MSQWHILPVPCCELKTDEGKRLAESWGAILLEESQVWGMEPTRGWEQGSPCAVTDVPSSPGDHGNLHEAH